jgi:hypothetical protein
MKEPLLYGNYEKLFCSLEMYKDMSYNIIVNSGGFKTE